MFSELFLKENEKTYKDASGVRKVLAFPLFGTVVMVVIGCVLGGLSLSQIWGLFGAANQLLAGIALMAVAAWLGEVGKNMYTVMYGCKFPEFPVAKFKTSVVDILEPSSGKAAQLYVKPISL